ENGRVRECEMGLCACMDRCHGDRGTERLAARSGRAKLVELMYKRILVPVEHSDYDIAIIEHVRKLANFCGASVVLMHVADGWAARNVKQLQLRESEEMRVDREYLEHTCAVLEETGIRAECILAGGDPSKEIAEAAVREGCDLIAMSTHG